MKKPGLETFDLVPGLAAHQRVTLGHAPTPIDSLARLGAKLGVTAWAKRDDCNGLVFGGNKVRQLEYYLGPGVANNADTLLITGAVQSNFVRLAAAAACRLGWDAHVQLEERVAKTDPLYRNSGNVLLDRLLGAKIHIFPEGENEAAADGNLDAIAAGLRKQGRNPYVIHLGMSHPPLGGLGYVAAAVETWDQLRATEVMPTHVVVPSGSGLTHAGFLVGARAIGWQVSILGICVRRGAEQQRTRVLHRASEIAAMIGREGLIGAADIEVFDDVLAPGYGQLNEATLDAIRLGARLEALVLDPVYSGRTLAGLVHLRSTGIVPEGSSVLFLHTGGAPAVFAYGSALEPLLDS